MARSFSAKVGIAVMNIETGDTFSYNGMAQMPMQSTYKFPQALAALSQVEKGKLSLEQKVFISKAEMIEETWSPMRDSFPNGNINLTVARLLTYTVSYSDNIACDVVFKLLGGPATVEAYLDSIGIKGVKVLSTEDEMHQDGSLQYKNWAAPVEMVKLLQQFYTGKLLNAEHTTFLRNQMEHCFNSAKRIKDLLPDSVVVAHKTGTSFTDGGRTHAVNDIGIITLPNGQHIAIAMFVSDTNVPPGDCEAWIARVTRMIYDDAILRQ
jgi:beta-lactamase class A